MDDGERKEFISRIGTFFLLLGFASMWLFIIADMSSATNFIYFFVSIILLVLGWNFKRITASAPKAGNRFEALRKIIQKRREAKQKKETAKKK
ncbi:MAG: hypothetical protein RBS68_06415 [Anaerolineales bacterium]|jgi:cytochrome c biogenesis protein CcdA|nr:hypothetical protein [Anaerolineales bacterium]